MDWIENLQARDAKSQKWTRTTIYTSSIWWQVHTGGLQLSNWNHFRRILQTAHDISTTERKVLRSIAQHPLPLLYHYHPPVHFLHNATLLLGIACPRPPASKKMYCMPRGRFSSNGIQKTGRRWYERPAEQTSLSLSLSRSLWHNLLWTIPYFLIQSNVIYCFFMEKSVRGVQPNSKCHGKLGIFCGQ